MTSAATLKSVRLIHLYLGVFLTPSILFFCFSGALQTLNYNDASPDRSYQPPHWVSSIAQLHKKQTPYLPPRRPSPPAAAPKPLATLDAAPAAKPAPTQPAAPPPAKHNVIPMKIFFVFTTVGLAFSSLLGLYMSYKFNRNRMVVNLTLIAGVAVPIALIFL